MRSFAPATPIWCAGCGDFAVRSSLDRALVSLGIAPHDTMVLAGIGCSGTIQNSMSANGYHALHGRVLPTATGVAIANPGLTVVAAGGDGDGYAIGAGHLVHAFRRNPSFTYLLMNNGIYGLTKGQSSPTSAVLGKEGADGFDAIMTGLSIPATTFLARAYCGWIDQFDRLLVAALKHAGSGQGLAFLEVISPCVTYQDVYSNIESRLLDLDSDPDHDATDRGTAFLTSLEANRRGVIPVGVVYSDSPSSPAVGFSDPAHAELSPSAWAETYEDFMSTHRV
jgi:2-oxoglutarate ferredoxin oxidoreductase subunit beta